MTMIFGEVPSAGPHPNLDRIKVFDVYYAKLRDKTKAKK